MRKSRHNSRRNSSAPLFKIALALFVVICGGILLLASWRKVDHNPGKQESAVERQLRSAASRVAKIASDSRAASAELGSARNALEAMDYGRTRLHLHNAEEALTDLADRLDAVGSMLRNSAPPAEAPQTAPKK